jgi:hypothetical protein
LFSSRATEEGEEKGRAGYILVGVINAFIDPKPDPALANIFLNIDLLRLSPSGDRDWSNELPSLSTNKSNFLR